MSEILIAIGAPHQVTNTRAPNSPAPDFSDTPDRGGAPADAPVGGRGAEANGAERSDIRRLNGMQHVALSHRLRAIIALRADSTGARSASVCCCCC